MISGDTIAAISSATGPAARMILRLSGPDAQTIAGRFWRDSIPSHASASRGMLALRGMAIPSWCYVFKAPRSYTGEDSVEFHIPGNPLLAKMLLEELLRHGARAAEPGEFTARAYFNGRLDLTEAEGVAATIAAGSEQELAAARRLMSGELARRVAPAIDLLANTLALLEVGIDFSEEDVTFLASAQVSERMAKVDGMLRALLDESSRFERLRHEPTVVLVGRPNAGKSTLLNALAGHARAVVSPVAGTTRDILSAEVALPRGMIRLLDVAGLEVLEGREGPSDAHAPEVSEHCRIDARMREQAFRALEEADRVVLVVEEADARVTLPLPRKADLMVLSKCDLLATRASGSFSPVVATKGNAPPANPSPSPGTPGEGRGERLQSPVAEGPSTQPSPGVPGEGVSPTRAGALRGTSANCRVGVLAHRCGSPGGQTVGEYAHPTEGADSRAPGILISARTGHGLADLRKALDRLCFGDASATSSLALNARHVQAIEEARAALAKAATQVHAGPEFIALDLREALDALGRITGHISPDDLLGRIFSAFCIGK